MPDLRWAKGGEAVVTKLDDDRVTLLSTVPSAPGSPLAGTTEDGSLLRVKVARCRREPGGFEIAGRLVDASRDLRVRLAALAASRAG